MIELTPPPGVHSNAAAVPLPNDNPLPPTKRQRRPSVRLGDIGGVDNHQLCESNHLINRRPKSSSKNPTPNLSLQLHPNGKTKLKRVRSNWIASSSKTDEDDKFSGGDDDDDDDEIGFRDFDESDSGLKDQSPIHSLNGDRRGVKVRVSDGVELDAPSDTDVRTWNNNNNLEKNGVRVWLNRLGLGRYAPVFEIHEVDDEVLPQLTLEDLKDMGINAVGSRRKMYSSIQKLGKGFS